MTRKVTFSGGSVFLYDDDSPLGPDENLVQIPYNQIFPVSGIWKEYGQEIIAGGGNEISLSIEVKAILWENENDEAVRVLISRGLKKGGDQNIGSDIFCDVTIPKGTVLSIPPKRLMSTIDDDSSYADMSINIANESI